MKLNLSILEKRSVPIKKLDKIPILDDDYLMFLSEYKTAIINEDLEIFDYEKALNSNRYIEKNFTSIINNLWIIGRTGQGDEWFLDLKSCLVLFYDHEQGEYPQGSFTQMDITFSQLIQIGMIIKALDERLEVEEISEQVKQQFIAQLNSVAHGFYERYPYRLW